AAGHIALQAVHDHAERAEQSPTLSTDCSVADDQSHLTCKTARRDETRAIPNAVTLRRERDVETPIHEADHRDQTFGHERAVEAAEYHLHAAARIGRDVLFPG